MFSDSVRAVAADQIERFAIDRFEGFDWRCEVYLRPNYEAEDDVQQWGEASTHFVELSLRSLFPSDSDDDVQVTMTVLEFEQLVNSLKDLAGAYRAESSIIADEAL